MKRTLLMIVLVGFVIASPITSTGIAGKCVGDAAALVGGDDDRFEAIARARSAGMQAKAVYRDRDTGRRGVEQRLQIEIERARPNAAYGVRFRGQRIGVIRTNALGRGELNFRTAAFIDRDDQDEWRPIQENFRRVRPGEVMVFVHRGVPVRARFVEKR